MNSSRSGGPASKWEVLRDALPQRQAEADRQYRALDDRRKDQLAAERRRYDAACRVREKDVEEHNAEIVALIAGLGYGVPDAVQEYLDIVLANSVYPEDFEVRHEATFDAGTAEARIRAIVPAPDELPSAKTYRWVKASDEIVANALTKKDQTDRYSDAIAQVALRTLHEVFEADRRGIIQSIALEVGPATKDPATGLDRFFPLIAVGAARERFVEFDLSSVIPAATLQLLGAAISKSPLTLTVVDAGGVRRS
jgi:restriction system protein